MVVVIIGDEHIGSHIAKDASRRLQGKIEPVTSELRGRAQIQVLHESIVYLLSIILFYVLNITYKHQSLWPVVLKLCRSDFDVQNFLVPLVPNPGLKSRHYHPGP